MFGIIYGLVNIGGRIIGSVQDNLVDNEHKQTMYDSSTNTYLDHNYVQRDIATNQLRYEKIVDGDKCLMGYSNKGSYIVRNLDKERRIKELKEAKDNNKTVVQYNLDEHIKDKCQGVRYIDALDHNRLLVIREYKEENQVIAKIYMDVKTGLGIRCTDGEIERQNKCAQALAKELDELWNTDKDIYNKRISGLKKQIKKYYYKIYRNSVGFHKIVYQNDLIINKFNEHQEYKAKLYHERNSNIYFGRPCGSEIERS